jgi:hypothetical protein
MTITQASLVVTILMLATLGTSPPVVQADESSDAEMKHQLEELRQQLRELQLKVQRMEVESRAGPAAKPGSSVSSKSYAVPTQTTLTPPPATQSQTAVTEPAKGAAAPSSTSPQTVGTPQVAIPGPTTANGLGRGTPPTPTVVTEALEWHEMLKEQWHSIKAGMTTDDIKKLLGPPSRAFTLDGRPVWYYSYPGLGNGSVLFGRESHTVTSWQQPPLGFGFGFW